MTSITFFDAFVLLISVLFETSILSYSSIYSSYKHPSKKNFKLEKQIKQLLCYEALIFYFKVNYHQNQI